MDSFSTFIAMYSNKDISRKSNGYHPNKRMKSSLTTVDGATSSSSYEMDMTANHIRSNGASASTPMIDTKTISSSTVQNSSSSSNNNTSNNNKMNEYDEGMYIFRDEINIRYMEVRFQTIGIYYNVALSYIRQDQYMDAQHWLHITLQEISTILQSMNHDNTTTMTMTNGNPNEVHVSPDMDDITTNLLVQIYHNCGYCSYQLGQMKEALDAYEFALSLITNTLEYKYLQKQSSSSHQLSSSTLPGSIFVYEEYQARTCNCVAVVLYYLHPMDSEHWGNCCSRATQLFLQSLFLLEDRYGRHSKSIVNVLNNLGRLYNKDGKYQLALQVGLRSLQIRCMYHETNTIDYAATAFNVASSYQQCHQYDEAIVHYMQFVRITEPLFGPNHWDVAVTKYKIAELFRQMNNYDQSKIWFVQSVSAFKSILGTSHPLVSSVLSQIGGLLVDMKQYEEALSYHIEAIHIKQLQVRWDDPYLPVALTNIAQIYYMLGQYQKAIEHYEQIQVMQTAIYGANSLDVATTLSSKAQIHYQQNDFDESFDAYQQVLTIQRDRSNNQDTTDIANTLSSMGLVLFQKGELELARSCFMESLRINRPILGDDHCDIAILWYNLASIALKSGEEDKAIELYNETLRIERLSFNVHVKSTYGVTVTLQHLAVVLQRQGEFDLAVQQLEEALYYECQMTTLDHVSIGTILNSIGNIQFQSGNISEMMSCFIEASRIFNTIPNQSETLQIIGFPLYLLSKLHPKSAAVA